MCGLIGMAGDLTVKNRDVFNELLIVDSIRGPHSTGVFVLEGDTKGSEHLAKCVGSPFQLFGTDEYKSATKWHSNLMIGHNRWATKGAVNKLNAHPFEATNIVGAHNGTLREYSQLPDYNLYDVDSECLINAIDALGVDEAISKTSGAYALTWYNRAERTINLLRNDERTLFYCVSTDHKTLYWASEKGMLEWILTRNKINFGKIVDVTPHNLYTFNIPQGYLASNKIDKARVRRIEPRKVVQQTTKYYNRLDHWNSGYLPAPKNQQKGDATNVAPFHRSQVSEAVKEQGKTSPSASTIKLLTSHLNQKLHFFYEGYVVRSESGPHIRFSLVRDPSIHIRYYLGDNEQFNDNSIVELMGEDKIYCGIAKAARSVPDKGGNCYLVLDKRSVQVAVEDTKEDKTNPVGLLIPQPFEAETKYITFTEFQEYSSEGCCWCSTTPSVREASKMLWLDQKYFLCGDCKLDKTCQQYLV